MTFVLGLTGSMGMGKSTTADLFRARGIPVYDADQTVHRLYEGRLARLIEDAFPGTVHDGRVDRSRLAGFVLHDEAAMRRLEAIVHPEVQKEQDAFLNTCRMSDIPLAVLDIPLLYEKGKDKSCDAVLVVSAPANIQRARLLSRPDMTPEKLDGLLARQMDDQEKRRRADFVIDTSVSIADADRQLTELLASLAKRNFPHGSL